MIITYIYTTLNGIDECIDLKAMVMMLMLLHLLITSATLFFREVTTRLSRCVLIWSKQSKAALMWLLSQKIAVTIEE